MQFINFKTETHNIYVLKKVTKIYVEQEHFDSEWRSYRENNKIHLDILDYD